MTVTYGLTDQGLVVKSRLVLRDDFSQSFKRSFGNAFDTSDASSAGQLIGIVADRLGDLWELLETIASAIDPDKATGTLLDALCLITGTQRPSAAHSTAPLTFTGVAGTVVPATYQFAAATTLGVFATQASVTLITVPNWAASTAYTTGQRVTSVGNVYQCTTGGLSGLTAPILVADIVIDGSVIWTFVGPGVAAGDTDPTTPAQSVDFGPVIGNYKDISQIINSVSGLQAVTNLVPATLGRLTAKDPELRLLREAELGDPGSSPFDALVAKLLQIIGVTAVTLFVNNTDTTDVNGLPPHSVEALVVGGLDQDIIDQLLRSVAAGIGTHGNTTGTSTDSQGQPHTMSFSRAVPLNVFVRVTVTSDPLLYPVDGDTEASSAIATFGSSQPIGRDVVPAAVGAQAFQVPGVINTPLVMVFTDAIAAPTTWAPTTGYSATVGSRSVVLNNGFPYICTTTGTSAGSVGPVGVGSDITDGTVHWAYLGNPVVVDSRHQAVYAGVSVTSTSGTP